MLINQHFLSTSGGCAWICSGFCHFVAQIRRRKRFHQRFPKKRHSAVDGSWGLLYAELQSRAEQLKRKIWQ